jgi:hypothetical protein
MFEVNTHETKDARQVRVKHCKDFFVDCTDSTRDMFFTLPIQIEFTEDTETREKTLDSLTIFRDGCRIFTLSQENIDFDKFRIELNEIINDYILAYHEEIKTIILNEEILAITDVIIKKISDYGAKIYTI